MLLTTFDYFFELTIQKSVILTSRESLVTFNNETKCEIDKILLINLEVWKLNWQLSNQSLNTKKGISFCPFIKAWVILC